MFPFRRKNATTSEDQYETENAPKNWSTSSGWQFISLVDITGGLWDLLTDWMASRRWNKIMALIPVILIGLTLGILTAIGKLSDENKRLARYVERADQEIRLSRNDSSSEEGNSVGSTKERSELIDLLFRRVLQINKNNKRAIFHVASQFANYGKYVVARQMMEGLAPAQHAGFELAHAWLAEDLIRKDLSGQKISAELLKHHLKIAVARQDVNPKLLIVYTQMLQRDEQISEAEQFLPRVAKFEPSVLLGAIALHNRHGLSGQAKVTCDLLLDSIKDKLQGDQADPYVVIGARAYAMTGRIDEGILLLQKSLKQRPQSALLRRAISDAFLAKFQSTTVKTESQLRVNFDLLNAAIAYDPTNLSVKEIMGSLASVGLNDSVMDSLRAQIAASGTSFAARLMMADTYLRRQNIEAAIKEYEVVLAELPNMTLVLNDLSMLYTMLDMPRLDEAITLIDRAVGISPDVSEFHDSRAQVLLACGRKSEALDEFLIALERSPLRINTREKLIATYREIGQTEAAELHQEKLAEVKQFLAERAEKTQTASPPANSLDSTRTKMVD